MSKSPFVLLLITTTHTNRHPLNDRTLHCTSIDTLLSGGDCPSVDRPADGWWSYELGGGIINFGMAIDVCYLVGVYCRSGGPMMDIVETAAGSQTGYLAVDAIDYAEAIARILYNTKETNDMIRMAAR